MITETFTIGLDDTDTAEAGGTGALARELAAYCAAEGWGEVDGVTRHRLIESDKVKSTNGNFAYAVVLRSTRSILDVEDDIVDFVRARATPGADPGIAIMTRHSDMPHVLAFGRRTQQEVMRLDWAQTFSTEANVSLRALGAGRRGTVGALAAAGLRGGGGDGLFIDLPGIREIEGRVTAGQIRERTALQTILDEHGEPLDRDDTVDTQGWVRPRLEGGEPVYHTIRATEDRRLWLPVDRRPANEPEGD